MRIKPRVLAAVPVAVAVFALAGCGSGSDSADSAPAGQEQPAKEADGEKEKKEPPLTGDIKAKAEKAALAAVPGTVVKSEEDAEKPGMYAVEVKKADSTSVEVYMDKSFKVAGTKQEGREEEEENAR